MANTRAWTVAKFGDCIYYRRRQELLVHGERQRSIGTRPLEVLSVLIDERHRVVSKAQLLTSCWKDETADFGALARAVMRLRNAIGDLTGDNPVVRTVHGIGYRFEAAVKLLDDDAATGTAAARALRVAVLPVINESQDASLTWVEYGLMSMVSKLLSRSGALDVLGADQVLASLRVEATQRLEIDRRVAVVHQLDPDAVVGLRLASTLGRTQLYVSVWQKGDTIHDAHFDRVELPELAEAASQRVLEILDPSNASGRAGGVDLGDRFLNETWVRAMYCANKGLHLAASRLIDLLLDAGVAEPEVLLEAARVHTSLGQPQAQREVDELIGLVAASERPRLLAEARRLRAQQLAESGQPKQAAELMAMVIEEAETSGHEALAVHSMITRASYLNRQYDSRAYALLTQAIPRAERLGNLPLIEAAHRMASHLAASQNAWLDSLRHAKSALAIAQGLHEARRARALAAVAAASVQLALPDQAADHALQGWRLAKLSMSTSNLGWSAFVAMQSTLAAYRLEDAGRLYEEITALPSRNSLVLYAASEVLCRATLLAMMGPDDSVEELIDQALKRFSEDPLFQGYAYISLLRYRIRARNWSGLRELCDLLRNGNGQTTLSPRIRPWIARCEAIHTGFARGDIPGALSELAATMSDLPNCQARGHIALESAWLHLERGESNQAQRLMLTVPDWVENTAAGRLVAARLHHELGRYSEAVTTQRQCVQRYGHILEGGLSELLPSYEKSQRLSSPSTIAPLPLPLLAMFSPTNELALKLPSALRGGRLLQAA